MFDDRKATGNPGRITCCGAQGESQQQFPDEAPATVYTDSARVYLDLPFEHESVNHSIGEYVRQQAHTNGIESFWAMLKQGYYGTYHRMSVKHLQRYVNEFAGRHGIRMLDTIDQMKVVARRMDGKRLKYQDLIA